MAIVNNQMAPKEIKKKICDLIDMYECVELCIAESPYCIDAIPTLTVNMTFLLNYNKAKAPVPKAEPPVSKKTDRIKRVTLLSMDKFGVELHPIVLNGNARGKTVKEIRSIPGGVILLGENEQPIVEYINIPMIIDWEGEETPEAKESIY